jgi:hypothetical protein
LGALGAPRLPGEEASCQAFDLAIHRGETIRRKGTINADLGALGLSVLKGSQDAGLLHRYVLLLPRLFQLSEIL